jgi:glucuronoarabinoxylan endo-1,4-beta-xylanase
MVQHVLFCIILIGAVAAHAQDINIHGKVTNSSGTAVSGAVVELVKEGIKDTTGADGSYLITDATGTIPRSLLPQAERIALVNGVLKVSLTEAAPVTITIMDIDGSLVKKEVYRKLQPGYYRLDVAQASRAAKLLVVNASIGNRTTTFRYFPLQNGAYATNRSGMQTASFGGKLAKMAAAINDTVKVTADGYAVKKTSVTSYDQELNITLFAEGAVVVQLDATRQVIDGFGINNNWKPLGNDGINACFDSVNGLGLSILRIGMFSSGDLFSGNNWNDVRDATAKGCKYIIGSTWSPPREWKTNNNENDGGHLKPGNYTDWANRIAGFPAKCKQGSGVDLYAMSIGNEPDFASCGSTEPCNGNYPTTLYTAEEMVNFIKVVGPKLQAAGCKVIAPEASEWIHTWYDTSGCCSVPGGKPSSDPLKCGCFTGKTTPCGCAAGKGYSYGKYMYEDKAAWAALDILGVHQYDTQVAVPWPDYVAVEDRVPVWQTEMSGVKWWPEGTPSASIENGIAVAEWIHNALTVGELNAWCYWWWQAMGDTNEGLLQANGTDTKRHYTFGQFSRYVRPGMTRVDIAGDVPADVLLTAYKGNNNKVVIVAINKGSSEATIPISISGGTAPASMMPVVTSGSANENWSEKTAVPVTNGVFTATIGGKTVTTFVSK